jgi:hypothetical protein
MVQNSAHGPLVYFNQFSKGFKMTFSNSKLTKLQKSERKVMLADILQAGGSISTVDGVTVVIVPEFPGSNMARMSLSFAAPEELKYRRKVGEFHALTRHYDNQSVPVPVFFEAQSVAEVFSDMESW